MYVCIQACMCVGLCAYVWKLHVKPEISVPNLPQSFSSLFNESGSLNKTQSSPTWLVSLACWFWGSPVSSFPGITDRSPRLPHTHVGSGCLDSGPYSCATNILTTKLSSSLQLEFLWLASCLLVDQFDSTGEHIHIQVHIHIFKLKYMYSNRRALLNNLHLPSLKNKQINDILKVQKNVKYIEH